MDKLLDQLKALSTSTAIQTVINLLVLLVVIYFIYAFLTKEDATDGAGTQFTGNGYYPQGTLLSDVNPNATTVSALSGAALAAPWPSYNIDGFTEGAFPKPSCSYKINGKCVSFSTWMRCKYGPAKNRKGC